MREMLELVDKDVKTTIMDMLSMFKKIEEIMTVMQREIEDILITSTQVEFLEMKNSVSKLHCIFNIWKYIGWDSPRIRAEEKTVNLKTQE